MFLGLGHIHGAGGMEGYLTVIKCFRIWTKNLYSTVVKAGCIINTGTDAYYLTYNLKMKIVLKN